MILSDITLEQDATLCVVAERLLQSARMVMQAMRGEPLDPVAAQACIFEAAAGLTVAFPDEVDPNTVRQIMIRTGLGSSLTAPPVNDNTMLPMGAA